MTFTFRVHLWSSSANGKVKRRRRYRGESGIIQVGGGRFIGRDRRWGDDVDVEKSLGLKSTDTGQRASLSVTSPSKTKIKRSLESFERLGRPPG